LPCEVAHQAASGASGFSFGAITDFTEAALSEKAQSVLERNERIVLSQRDFAHFVELIDNPPPPTRELREAMAEYRQLKAAHLDANL